MTCGTTLIHIGRPALPMRTFYETTYKRLMLIPYITARGPNGAWLIRRGPNHPHLLLTDNRTAYYVVFDGHGRSRNAVCANSIIVVPIHAPSRP